MYKKQKDGSYIKTTQEVFSAEEVEAIKQSLELRIKSLYNMIEEAKKELEAFN